MASKGKKISLIKNRGKMDIGLVSVILILLTIGLVMLFSASYAYSYHRYGNSYHFISKQFVFAIAGLVAMYLISLIDYHFWRKLAVISYVVIIGVLIFLAVSPPMLEGTSVKRWLVIGPISIQPSEFAKISIIILFSAIIAREQKNIKKTKTWLTLGVLLVLMCGCIIAGKHISATVLVLLIGAVLLYVGGISGWLIFGGGLGAAAAGLTLIYTGVISYGADRLNYWFNPWLDPNDKGLQTIQSLIAIGSGGLLGRGFGQSRQKYLWLPEPHNDFIFSIVCEELGLIGALIIVLLFCLLIWRGFTVAMRAPDKFGSLMAIGITFQVGIQALLNIAVVTNTLPNTGISLPFFSYGGTSLLVLLAEMGILLSISRSASIEKL